MADMSKYIPVIRFFAGSDKELEKYSPFAYRIF